MAKPYNVRILTKYVEFMELNYFLLDFLKK